MKKICLSFTKQMTNIWVYEEAITPQECEEIIQTINEQPMVQKSGGRLVGSTPLENLTKIVSDTCKPPPYVFKHSHIKKVDPHNTDYNYWFFKRIHPEWAIVKSPPGCFLGPHIDRRTILSVDCVSFYTVLCYLNDCKGGTLFFHESGRMIQPKRGTIVVFDQNLSHQALPNEGTKYIARSSLLYERSTKLSTAVDERAVDLFNNSGNSIKLEEEALEMSPALEEIVLEF